MGFFKRLFRRVSQAAPSGQKRYEYPTGNIEFAWRVERGEKPMAVMEDIHPRWTPGNEYLWDDYDPESLLDSPEKARHTVNALLFGRLTAFRALRSAGRDVRGQDPFDFADQIPEVFAQLRTRFPSVYGEGASHGLNVEVRTLNRSPSDPGAPTGKETDPVTAPGGTQAHAGDSNKSVNSNGRRRTKLPRPENVRQFGPLVGFSNGAVFVTMDREAFDYTYGDADGPDPAQKDLDALLPNVTHVCVLEGAMYQGRAMGGPVLLDTRDVKAIQNLAGCLQIVEDPCTFDHCACLGGPTMELYAGHEHIATLGLQHGRAIRWKHWYHDAQLQSGNRLTRWLHDQGIDPTRLEAIYHRGNNFLVAEPSASSGHRQEAHQLCAQAKQRAQDGKLAEALQLCTRALELDPDLAEGYAIRGQVRYNSGLLPEAADDCFAAIDRGFRHAEIYFIRAIALDVAGQGEEALANCSMALHLNPEHAGAYNSRGLIRGHLGRLAEALEDFSEAIRLAPKWFVPYLHRAQVNHARGLLDTALTDYDSAVNLVNESSFGPGATEGDPQAALVYCRRGDVRLDLIRDGEAEADFAEARRRHPVAAASYLGDMWLRRSSFDRAREAFTQLVRLRPEDAQSYLGRGLAQEGRGDLEQAADDYSSAIRLRPDCGAYHLRARVRRRQGYTEDALADLTEHLRFHANDVMAYVYRYMLHRDRKEWAAAFADLNTAHAIAPDHPEVCNCLAWMLATRSDPQVRDVARAVALARHACQATAWKQPHILETFAAALAATNAFDEAVHWQEQAILLSTDETKSAWEARLKLYQAGQPYLE
jgi:tetratricopeptide (TPR) repeat protein